MADIKSFIVQNRDYVSFGLTSAISAAQPTPSDILQTKQLEDVLKSFHLFENEQEIQLRELVVDKLNQLTKGWIKSVCIKKNLPDYYAEKVGGKIFPFGSHRLGVNNKGADIDALCVAPQYVTREDFFGSFFELLKKHSEVAELRAIEEAFVPVIKMKFDGIEVDMLFARLKQNVIPDSMDLQDDNLLKNLDEKCVRSLNGCRVTEEIIHLVPNIETFQLALRTIKLWAKQRGIYSNILGYLGGVAWAMLVARICQLYPNAAASTIVEKFFLVFSKWEWPKPVLLQQPSRTNFGFTVWDPRSCFEDRYHLMPIITPAYPQQNSTFNVSMSTRSIMMDEIKVGLEVMQEINLGKATWNKLFEPPLFFMKYRHFVALKISANTPNELLEWQGLVESKIRLLIAAFEKYTCITIAHPNPCNYPVLENSIGTGGHSSMWFIGLEFNSTKGINVDFTSDIAFFVNKVNQFASKIQMWKMGMTIEAKYVRRKELAQYIPESLIKQERKLQGSKKRKASESSESSDNGIPTKRSRLTNDASRTG